MMNAASWSLGVRLSGGVCAVLLFGIVASRGFAQATSDDSTRAAARVLGAQGIDAYRAGDYGSADVKLDRAYRLYGVPTLGLWSARARAQLGRLVEAAERYREVKHMSAAIGNSETQQQAQRDAASELEALVPRIPTLTIQLENAQPSEVSATLDGNALHPDLIGIARPTDVGTHKLVATRAGERVEVTVELAERDAKSLPVHFEPQLKAATNKPELDLRVKAAEPMTQASAPQAASTDSPLLPIAGIALGVGALGLTTWAVGALLADGKLDSCPEKNGKRVCDTQGRAETFTTWKTISTVGFYSGIAFGAAGLGVLLWDATRERPRQGLSWGIGPAGASLQGAF